MKKYCINILILLMFAGTFTPIAQVQAACSLPEFTTEAECAGRGIWNSSGSDSVCRNVEGIGNLICRAHQILNSIIPVLIALGIVYFVWGVVQYVIGDEEEAKKKGKNRIIYGIIGLAVIIGLFGLVNIVVVTFGINSQQAPPPPPVLPGGGGCHHLATAGGHTKLQDLLNCATYIIGASVIPLIFAVALLMFVFGVVQFVMGSDEEARKTKGKQFMLWGIIALTVMVSVWGLVKILAATFYIDTTFIPQVSRPAVK